MIIVDTGAWVGLANRRDDYHQPCRRFFLSNREPLITTYPVLVETVHLLYQRVGVAMALSWIDTIRHEGLRIFTLEESHLPQIVTLMRQYQNLPMDLADASLVIPAEAVGRGCIVSTDQRDFITYRWKNHEPFRNLLELDG